MDFDEYTKKLDSIGESILTWADPESDFRGYTEVRVCVLVVDVSLETLCYTCL